MVPRRKDLGFPTDLIVGSLVVAELKAARALEPFHEAQLAKLSAGVGYRGWAVAEFWSGREN